MDSPVITPPASPGDGDQQANTERRRRFGWWALLGCVIVLLASAGAAAVAVLEQVNTVVHDLNATKALKVDKRVLATSSFGQPETLLMVGDDTRSVFKYYYNNPNNNRVPNLANEMLVVRIDPSKPWISMMSIPRELWVNITEPNGVTYPSRLNSAYTYGTTTLLKTIKQVTGLSVNHVIATTFTQFENAINRLGCVYDTIDERYYHNNADGGAQYQNVDLQPGYQCLNGSQAEQFVSYRHTDTSQVRDARDQSFLLAVKQQYGPELAGNIGTFEKIFGETVQTDAGLRSSSEILNLANLLITAAGLRVRQVPFQASACLATCPNGDLTATPQQIHDSVTNFLFGGDVTPTKQTAAISHQVSGHHGLAQLPLTATLDANVAAEKAATKSLPFTAEFPRVQDRPGSAVPIAEQCTQVTEACIRSYLIHAPNGDAYPIYTEVFSNGDLGQYYDVQGTTWTGAPLFAHPNQTIRVGTRTYDLFYEGSHLQTVAWQQYGAIYWVHNTLTDSVSNGELLAIAEQTAPVGAVHGVPPHLILKAFSVPTRTVPAATTPPLENVGRVGGVVTLALLPLGLVAAFRSRLRLRRLRDQTHAAAARTAVLETQIAAATAGYGPTVAPKPPASAASVRSNARLAGAAAPVSHYRSRRPWIPLALVLVLVAAAGAAYLVFDSGSPKPKPKPLTPPTAPVAVLNSGHVANAAHRLAIDLTRHHVHVVATGNLRAAPPRVYEIFYTRGNAHQAQLLAAVLKAHRPQIRPVNATMANAIGTRPRLVVVIP